MPQFLTICAKCGCTIAPDAIKCPICNAVYGDSMQQSTDSISQYLPEPEAKGASAQTVVLRYQIICPRNSKINIKATMTA